jgi:hypothetical protein
VFNKNYLDFRVFKVLLNTWTGPNPLLEDTSKIKSRGRVKEKENEKKS